MNSVGQALAAQLDLDALIELVGERVRETFDADIVYVALHDEAAGADRLCLLQRGRRAREEPSLEYGQGLTSRILESGEPLVLNRSEQYDELATTRVGTPSRSYLGVPIVVGDRAIGVISVQSTREVGRFGEADSGLLATIAANVGVAIQNARLFEAQRAAEQQYRGLVEELPLVVYTDKPDASGATAGIPVYISPRVEQIFGYPAMRGSRKASPNQSYCPRIGRALRSYARPPRSRRRTLVHRVSRSRGGRASGLGPRRRLDRSRRAGAPTHLQGFMIDITAQVEAAAELDRQKQYFESLVEISPVAIVVMDADERVTGWNPAAAELFGWSPEEAIGRLIDDLVVGGDLREEGRDVTREALEAGRAHRITRRWRKDGDARRRADDARAAQGGRRARRLLRDLPRHHRAPARTRAR